MEFPELLISCNSGRPRRPTKALPRLFGEDNSSISVSSLSCTLPRFSTSKVKVASKVPSANKPATSTVLATPIRASSAGGATGVGEPGPPGFVVGNSPVGLPAMSVVVLLASLTRLLVPMIVPVTFARLFSTPGVPSALGLMFTLNSTENSSLGSNRELVPVISSIPPARPVKPSPVEIGATELPLELLIKATTGTALTSTKALPRFVGSSSKSVSCRATRVAGPVFRATSR